MGQASSGWKPAIYDRSFSRIAKRQERRAVDKYDITEKLRHDRSLLRAEHGIAQGCVENPFRGQTHKPDWETPPRHASNEWPVRW